MRPNAVALGTDQRTRNGNLLRFWETTFRPAKIRLITLGRALIPCCHSHLLSRGSTAMDVQRFLIGLGLVFLVTGIMWPLLSRIGLGRLPGDIMFQRGGATFYFPLVTCIIISILVSALFWLFNR